MGWEEEEEERTLEADFLLLLAMAVLYIKGSHCGVGKVLSDVQVDL